MANWNKAVITENGKALQARVNAGEGALKIVGVAIGSGTPATLETATNLAHKEMDVQLSGNPVAEGNVVAIDGVITNVGVTKAFNITELGIFAQLGDDAATKALYSIQTDPNPDSVPAYGGATGYSQAFYLRETVSNMDNITVELNIGAFITVKQLQTALNQRLIVQKEEPDALDDKGLWCEILEG